MADLNDLPLASILDMEHDEAIEHIRQIRLSRRTPVKVQKTTTTKKRPVTENPTMSASQAAELLKLLEGEL